MAKRSKETKKELAARLGVSVSSLYYKPKRPAIDEEVKLQIEAVMAQNPTYGHKRIARTLKLNKKRILRVMHKYNLKPYRRRKKRLHKKADRNLPPVKHTNVSQVLCPVTPDVVWVSDFTYIKYQGKFIYLATILDDFTREVVGFNTGRFHNKELVLGALEHALLSDRKPQYLHSDQGSEYQSRAYEKLAKAAGIQISMSAKSSPWENAKQESFYSHFKVWLGDTSRFETQGHLIAEIYKYMHYYNTKRQHSALNDLTPSEFYSKVVGT